MESSPWVPGQGPGSHQLKLTLLRSERAFDGMVPRTSQNVLRQWYSGVVKRWALLSTLNFEAQPCPVPAGQL